MFPQILRKLRMEQKLTQSDMAKVLNISRVAYTNYELGNREPDFGTITRIANILGTSVDYLLGNSSVRTPSSGSGGGTPDLARPDLRVILNSVSHLSHESCADLQNYIELLKIREEATGKRQADKSTGSHGESIFPKKKNHERNP